MSAGTTLGSTGHPGTPRPRRLPLWQVTLAIVVATLINDASTSAQRMTIPEILASGGGIASSQGGSGVAPSVESMVRYSDVVVIGTITNPVSALTADQTALVTTYALYDPVFIKPTNMALSSAPGVAPSLSLMQKGGTITISGKTISYREGRLPLMTNGMRGIFFLRRDGESFWLASGDDGALKIENDTVTTFTARTDFAPELHGLTAAEAITRLSAMSR